MSLTALLRAALIGVALCLFSVTAAVAQTEEQRPLVERWERTADRAEEAIDSGEVSDEALEDLRAQLAEFRETFLDRTTQNAARIQTIEGQIEALGPAPAEGETEPPEIAERRADLNQQLQTLRAPILAAEESYNRADGLIGEIDEILRERQTAELFAIGPSPLNPALWPEALKELTGVANVVANETSAAWNNQTRRLELWQSMPVVLLTLAVGLLLLIRGPKWASWIGRRARERGGRGTGVWSFLISLGRVAFPVAGLVFLAASAQATGLVGLRGGLLVEMIPVWGAAILGFRWLSERLFAKSDAEAIVSLPKERRREARFYGTVLALLVILRSFFETINQVLPLNDAARSVIAFPVVVLGAVVLFRLGQILSKTGADEVAADPEATVGGLNRMIRLLGQGGMIVAVVAPVLAAIGYYSAGVALLYPYVLTLVIFGVVLVLQDFFTALYGWLTGRGDEARDALIPVLVGFLLVLLALPVLALAWGARVADLTELWTQFSEGFRLGETRISPTDFLMFVIVFVLGYLATRLFQGALRSNVLPKTKIDPGGQNAIVSGIGYVGIFLAAIIAITSAGLDLSSLAIVAGALSVGIGFGLQNIVSNFISGIILLVERPIAEGDWIEVGPTMGIVKSISVRSTRIETFDKQNVIVPNADFISGTVTNWTRGNTLGRAVIHVGVAYGTDTRKVERILREIAEGHPDVASFPEVGVDFMGFGADSLDFRIRAILPQVTNLLPVTTEIHHQIAERFQEEGIEIPFAQRDIWLRNPETLRADAEPEAPRDLPDAKAAE